MRNVIDENRVRKWEAWGGVCCFLGGILAGLMGTVLAASEWIVGAPLHRWIHVASTALFIIAIPLILFAGFCLDWAEREQKKPLPRDPQEAQRQAQRGAAALAQIALIAMIAGAALLAPGALQAQQTIFNVPTTDVLERGKVYVELDVPFKPNNSALLSRFSSFVPRLVVGTGGRVEIGLNITGNINPGPDSTTLVPAVKYKAYDGGDNGWAIVLGNNVFLGEPTVNGLELNLDLDRMIPMKK